MVEDCEDSCLLVANVLQSQAYAPEWLRVQTAAAMRDALTTRAWDVIIADFVVPGFDALASLKLARQLAPDLPFIVVSGNLGEDVAVAVMKAGAHDYVTKANLARLVPAIERELRDADTRRARRQAEAALQQKEALSRAVLDSLSAEIAVLNNDGVIVTTNAAWDACTQAKPDGAMLHPPIHSNYLDVFREPRNHPAKDKALVGIQRVLEGSLSSFAVQYPRLTDSTDRWFLLHATPLVNYGGAVISHIDLTVMKRAKAALRQSEARFRAVVDSLGEGLLLTDLNGQVWYANSRMEDLSGFNPAEMVQQQVASFFRLSGPLSDAFGFSGASEETTGRAELPLLRKDGSHLWVDVNAGVLRDSKRETIGTVYAITDISERRHAREALRKSQAGLLLAQRIGHVGSWELDLASRLMEWSAETYRIFDLAPSGTRPSFQQFIGLLADDDRLRVTQGLEKALHGSSSFRSDCCIIRPDASTRFVHLQAQMILDSNDKPIQMVGTIQDITERKLLEERLRHSQKMDAVGQLAGGIAHDFNNILTVIQGYTELIAYQTETDEQTRNYANQISVSAERASRLTRQLLAFSRKQLMQLKSLDLNALLANLAPMLQRLLGEQIQLHLNLLVDAPAVLADSGMVEQVLVNLIVNARDAMPKGGRLIIETSLHQIDPDYCRIHPEALSGQFVCLGIIDTGCGMDNKTLEHIFEPFFTTKEVGRGTGLGLPTVYGIVKQHQGWIQVASQLGRGSAFKVFLPLASPDAPMAAPIPPPKASAEPETILLVEDEPPLRQLAKSILERYGHRVLEAGSGPEALSLWKDFRDRIDLLLTDMVMPGGMTGRELALQLQSEDPSLKVLYTSGYSLDFVESDLLLREGVNFVPKPYSGTSLSQAVRTCLNAKS